MAMEAKQSQAISTFQEQAMAEEQQGNFHEALAICLNAMQAMEGVLRGHEIQLSDHQRLELTFNYDMAMSRSKFLFGVISLEGRNLFSTPPAPRSDVKEYLAVLDAENPTTTRAWSTESLHDITLDDTNKHIRFINPSSIHQDKSQENKNVPVAPVHESKKISEEMQEVRKRVLDALEVEIPNVGWDSVVGMNHAKDAIMQAVRLPIDFPGSAQAQNTWGGILLFGPSGVGKTQLIKAVASDSGITFMNVRIDSILSKWQGESEKSIQCLFDIARERSPTIMFLDECDSLCRARNSDDSEAASRIKTQLLTKMDGISSDNAGIIIIGNTNLPHLLDGAFKRRFEKRVYVGLPNRLERVNLLGQFLKSYDNDLDDGDITNIARRTEGFSGADLSTLVKTAGIVQCQGFYSKSSSLFRKKSKSKNTGGSSNENKLRATTMADFESALRTTTATNEESTVRELERWNEKFGDGRSSVQYDMLRDRENARSQSKTFKVFSFLFNMFD